MLCRWLRPRAFRPGSYDVVGIEPWHGLRKRDVLARLYVQEVVVRIHIQHHGISGVEAPLGKALAIHRQRRRLAVRKNQVLVNVRVEQPSLYLVSLNDLVDPRGGEVRLAVVLFRVINCTVGLRAQVVLSTIDGAVVDKDEALCSQLAIVIEEMRQHGHFVPDRTDDRYRI